MMRVHVCEPERKKDGGAYMHHRRSNTHAPMPARGSKEATRNDDQLAFQARPLTTTTTTETTTEDRVRGQGKV